MLLIDSSEISHFSEKAHRFAITHFIFSDGEIAVGPGTTDGSLFLRV